jgi:Family of unknown function (DUF6516)
VKRFPSLSEYERFIYTLPLHYSTISISTLVVVRRGADMVILRGELAFQNNVRLLVWERITLEYGAPRIETYGYEVWRGDEQQYWYDSQAHPNDPALASTPPHHKHVHPDIKHHRIPAPGLSFTQPNLPFLIGEIEQIFSAQ